MQVAGDLPEKNCHMNSNT